MELAIFFAGLVIGGFVSYLISSHFHRKASGDLDGVQNALSRKIDDAVHSLSGRFQVETHIGNPNMQDGGRISAEVVWQDGPIIDIGNPNELGKNRLLVVSRRPDQIGMMLYDAEGIRHELQCAFHKFDQMTRIECVWSSKEGVISLLADGAVLTMAKIGGLTIFQDVRDRNIRIGGSLEGAAGSGIIRNVKIFVEKKM
ncbi:MAG: hypothetical protein O2975_02085 [Proteobacteria bacterium]|nr:hypothetical protein [Pseudomonadota bacterium]